MKTGAAVIAALVWTLLVGLSSFGFGYYVRGARQATNEVQTLHAEATTKARKDSKALAAGVRAAKATTTADQAFQKIRSDYEADLRKNPRTGCVLDADSLRLWNEANAESGTDAAGEPAGEVSTVAKSDAGRKRTDEPH